MIKNSALLKKNHKGFRRRKRSKIGKDCQHTWKDLSGTTSHPVYGPIKGRRVTDVEVMQASSNSQAEHSKHRANLMCRKCFIFTPNRPV